MQVYRRPYFFLRKPVLFASSRLFARLRSLLPSDLRFGARTISSPVAGFRSSALAALTVVAMLLLFAGCKEDDLSELLLPGSTIPPKVLAAYPPDGIRGLDAGEGIWILFDQPMDERQTERAFSITGPAGQIQGAYIWQASTRLEFRPSTSLRESGQYFIRVSSSAESLAGIDLDEEYRATFSLSADTEGPSLVSSHPADGEQGVAADADLELTFSEPVSFESLQNGINVSPSFSFVLNMSPDGRTVIIQPTSNLVVGLKYTISITEDIEDLDGNPLANPDVLSFFTGTDFVAPQIVEVRASGIALTEGIHTSGIEKTGTIEIQFSEPMDQVITEENVSVSPSAEMTLSWSGPGDTLILTPTSLEPETSYEISIGSGVEDPAGNALSNPGEYPFTTDGPGSLRPQVVSVQQDRVTLPGGFEGSAPAVNYFGILPDYGIVDTSHTVDTNSGVGISEAFVFRVLFDRNMQLTSLYEALSFVPVIDTGGSDLQVHNISFGTGQNDVIILASWTPTGEESSPVYALQFSTDAKDTDGNALESRFRRYLSF